MTTLSTGCPLRLKKSLSNGRTCSPLVFPASFPHHLGDVHLGEKLISISSQQAGSVLGILGEVVSAEWIRSTSKMTQQQVENEPENE